MAKVSTRLLRTVKARKSEPAAPAQRASKVKLTKRLVDGLEPQPERDVFVWDTELAGFGVRMKPSGVRAYLVQYRNRNGRTRRLVLGRHGSMTAEQARAAARQQLAAAQRGEDPSADRHVARRQISVAQLSERYLNEYSEVHKKASSVLEDRRLIEKRVKPAFGPMPASAVTRDDVMRLHHALRKTPYEANRVIALLSKMFSLAEDWKVREQQTNPCYRFKKYREKKRIRYLTENELRAIGAAIREAEQAPGANLDAIFAIKLIALTGCRLSEVRTLRPEHVDFDAGVLRLPVSKTGAKVVPLGDEALKLLGSIDRARPYVVSGSDPTKPLPASTLERAWYRIRNSAGVEDARVHDWRHTMGTYGGQSGLNAFAVRDLLGHKTVATTDIYVERDIKPMRDAATAVSARIAFAMGGRPRRDGET